MMDNDRGFQLDTRGHYPVITLFKVDFVTSKIFHSETNELGKSKTEVQRTSIHFNYCLEMVLYL